MSKSSKSRKGKSSKAKANKSDSSTSSNIQDVETSDIVENTLQENAATKDTKSIHVDEETSVEVSGSKASDADTGNKSSIPESNGTNTSDKVHLNNKDLAVNKDALELFNSIYSGELDLTLPNRAWSIHCTDNPIRCIVISEISLCHDNGLGFVPFYTKQIMFDEKLNYEMLLLNSKTSGKNLSCTVKTLDDIMNIIAYTYNLKLCSGGPEVSLYNNVNIECAYRDNKERWRHNLCSLEVSEGDTCESCISLEDILKRHVQRNKQTSRTKSFVGTSKRKRINA